MNVSLSDGDTWVSAGLKYNAHDTGHNDATQRPDIIRCDVTLAVLIEEIECTTVHVEAH